MFYAIFAHIMQTNIATMNYNDTRSEFPFRRNYMPKFDDMFARLKLISINPPNEWSIPRERYNLGIVSRSFPTDFELTDSLADHFVESVRIKCREIGHKTPIEAWKSISTKIEQSLTTREKREAVYKISRGCNLFNTALCTYLIARFCNKPNAAILDPTAGWGDRLISAFAVPNIAYYHGWDTNPELQNVYKQIGNHMLVNHEKHTLNWHVEFGPFEDSVQRFHEGNDLHERFDIAILSPPIFTKELYLGAETSTNRYKTFAAWKNKFYIPLIKQTILGLKIGGYLLLYIYNNALLESNDAFDDLEYLGEMGFQQVIENSSKNPVIRGIRVYLSSRRATR